MKRADVTRFVYRAVYSSLQNCLTSGNHTLQFNDDVVDLCTKVPFPRDLGDGRPRVSLKQNLQDVYYKTNYNQAPTEMAAN
jgi:hypothetical protein